MKIGMIGQGAIARIALETLRKCQDVGADEVIILTREGVPGLKLQDGSTRSVDRLEALIEARPQLICEAAGHDAVRAYGEAVLQAGIDFIITSIGALADEALHARLKASAAASGARLILATGAIGGLDILAAAKLSGLTSVIYTARKPPSAWGLARQHGAEAVALYDGPAREAVIAFPKNANVAAAIALAGLGFEATRVRLLADPGIARNIHEIQIASAAADVRIEIAGHAAPDNPKTSLTTGYSLARAILDHHGRA
ncbi:MAG: aspartate dehydrogenase [Hyphomicrobiales bacterium]|nr:aspartate dehydrogenase [Hyphomicrobiales bacterium]